MNRFIIISLSALALTACVSQQKYAELQAEVERLRLAEPIKKATASEEQVQIEDMQSQLQTLRAQLNDAMRGMEKFEMLQAAGSIPQPTPEQMEAYRLKYDQDMQQREQDMTKREQEDELFSFYFDRQMDLKVLEAGMEKAIEGYSKDQVKLVRKPSELEVIISNDELFDDKKKNLNSNGVSLLNKLSVAINGKVVVPYNIVMPDNNDQTLSNDRGLSILTFLNDLELTTNEAQGVIATNCTVALGEGSKNCDKSVLRFRTDYSELIKNIERAQVR